MADLLDAAEDKNFDVAEGSEDKDFEDMSREELLDFLEISKEDAKDFSMKTLLDIAYDKGYDPWGFDMEEDKDMVAISKLKAMAGIGSNAMSNHGIREGETGYQITPRSIVARNMRKLQDLEK